MLLMRRRVKLLGAGLVVLAGLAIGPRALANITAPNCTIRDVLEYQDVQSNTATELAVDGKPATDMANRFPGATVVEQAVLDLTSKSIPPVDGHRALVVRLDGMADQPVFGPVGNKPESLPVACGIAIYDADTGEFIVSMSRLGT